MNIERLLKSDNTVKRTGDVGDGILLAPKQGKKNLAKFLGIDMSALQAEAGEQTGHTGNTQAGPQLGWSFQIAIFLTHVGARMLSSPACTQAAS